MKRFQQLVVLGLAGLIGLSSCKKDKEDELKDESSYYRVTTLAGDKFQGYADGQGAGARFTAPLGIALDNQGNIFAADPHRIRRITPSGWVSTHTGTATRGSADGNLATATFSTPYLAATDGPGNLYIVDSNGIRVIRPAGEVITLKSIPDFGFQDGNLATALFGRIGGIALDPQGVIYFADATNRRIRRIGLDGMVSTIAGDGMAGTTDGQGSQARFTELRQITRDNQGNLYVVDDHSIRKITAAGMVSTLVSIGHAATNIAWPEAIVVNPAGQLFISVVGYWGGPYIARIDDQGGVSKIAGSITGIKDGVGNDAEFSFPAYLATDTQGNLYVSDYGTIRKIVHL